MEPPSTPESGMLAQHTEDTWNSIISPKTRSNWISPRSNERLKNAVAAYKEKTDKCHALAVELRERGLFAEAVRVLQRLWELDKDRPDTLVEMATALAAQGLHEEGAARIVEYAEVLATRGQVEDAQAAYESVMRKSSEDGVLNADMMASYLRFCDKHRVMTPGSGMQLLSDVCTDDKALASLATATQVEGMHTTAISLHQELFLRCVCQEPETRLRAKEHLMALADMYDQRYKRDVEQMAGDVAELKEKLARMGQ
eukprot:TRINITY_DN1419_c0_g1_i1.p1 TRINITY_DN1419_c0_g1~~TRINITY_DN1419_c0_g1_i1.p1  ORF type:complete len:256 (+),score=76.05 TRINITY_DN1419_c0_g1_i1:197-964(+)